MSTSRHPVALRLEQQVGSATKLLATVMVLPLIDGIFPALVVAGVLGSATGVVETGILIFGGSATAAVILAEMDGTRREMVASVLLIGAVIIPVAAVEAALAPTLQELLNLPVFERFAGLVILTIAAKTASSEIGEYLPSPGVIIGLGLVASFEPSGFALRTSTEYVVNGTAAAAVGVAFALSIALLSPHLRGRVDIDRFRFGSAVALGVLALPILLGPFDLMQTEAPVALAVLAVTTLFAYDPNSEGEEGAAEDDEAPDDDAPDGPIDGADESDADPTDADEESEEAPSEPPLDAPPEGPSPIVDDDVAVLANGGESRDADDDGADPFTDDDSRAPWL
ncbi:DUF5794 domain-containing protein [Halorubrum ezzemoulense]|uniref:Uncharacterized protein n=1 Tax=Halorubrum ezzemoulense TaxID=337243 RepID=A0A256JEU6_HALEZ|nr:DUF5794 domain-containing protein [Halorubrum ezzemoulense]MDB2242088.1 DUF5794 domain-containing protein [Halorubrum ezzemoulense]MDB2282894.1 DUF5794 domain-containing protein [Halorubrum ezzemoulense]MDB9252177.1 DUF5794 domain-containing protein [Halorubrum ezzemoulense]MDB9254811.1 DUF5794 domain-containing protein [Halorubrum ezzemoulense]MDB9275522.1 DUF5794 domain-containing protein [Halorubrum ezzemoulense]